MPRRAFPNPPKPPKLPRAFRSPPPLPRVFTKAPPAPFSRRRSTYYYDQPVYEYEDVAESSYDPDAMGEAIGNLIVAARTPTGQKVLLGLLIGLGAAVAAVAILACLAVALIAALFQSNPASGSPQTPATATVCPTYTPYPTYTPDVTLPVQPVVPIQPIPYC